MSSTQLLTYRKVYRYILCWTKSQVCIRFSGRQTVVQPVGQHQQRARYEQQHVFSCNHVFRTVSLLALQKVSLEYTRKNSYPISSTVTDINHFRPLPCFYRIQLVYRAPVSRDKLRVRTADVYALNIVESHISYEDDSSCTHPVYHAEGKTCHKSKSMHGMQKVVG